MNNFFNYDNRFFRGVNKVVDAFYASILWVVFCIPVVTIGASTTAFYYTVHKALRGNRGYVWRSFWSSFRSNFRQTTKITLILLAVFVLLFADLRISFQFLKQNSGLGALYYFFYFAIFFLLVWAVYIFSYSARFTAGLKATMKNAALIAVANLPWSALVLVLLLGGAFVVWLMPFFIMLMPAAVGCVLEIILERIFRKYMSEEDLQKEKELEWANKEL